MSDPISEAVEALTRGELVVFPTDTVYGLAARPDSAAGLFAAKRRSRDLAIPILVASRTDARRVAEFDERAERLADAWPGALTLVLPRATEARAWSLGGSGDTVAVRVPGHPLALALLARTGPLAVTSANRSGSPPLGDADALAAEFGQEVAVYLCQDASLTGVASTVLDLTGTEPRILRAGSITEEVLARFLDGEGPLLDSRPSP